MFELTNWYNSVNPPPAFCIRRVAFDNKFDCATRKWTMQTSLRYQSEHAEPPPTTSAPSSSTSPTAPAPVEAIPDDVVMDQSDPFVPNLAGDCLPEALIVH